MKIEQISVFLENRPGRLAAVTGVLADANINIKALTLADTSEYGMLRLITDNHEKAQEALKENGFTVGLTTVVAVEVPHKPGGLNSVVNILSGKGINVEYVYTFPYQMKNNAILIIRFDRPELAIEILQQRGVRVCTEEDICS